MSKEKEVRASWTQFKRKKYFEDGKTYIILMDYPVEAYEQGIFSVMTDQGEIFCFKQNITDLANILEANQWKPITVKVHVDDMRKRIFEVVV